MGNGSTGSEIGAAGELWTLYFVQSVFWSGKMWEGKGRKVTMMMMMMTTGYDMTWHDVIYNLYYNIYIYYML